MSILLNVLPQPLEIVWHSEVLDAVDLPAQKRHTRGATEPQTARGTTRLVWRRAQDTRVSERASDLLSEFALGELVIDLQNASPPVPQYSEQLAADESYELTVSPTQILLCASATWGALHGITTLWMLCASQDLAKLDLTIRDTPRFGWRGLCLDVARHFIPIAALQRVVEGMARLKLNVLHLHLSDDQAFRFPSTSYPKLASKASYTRADLKQLVEFAARRGVRIVPELDMPGHVNSWLTAYPEWGLEPVSPSNRFGVHKACLNPADEAVYAAIGTLLAEVCDTFPDQYVHLGGDEVHPQWWSTHPQIQNFMQVQDLPDTSALQAYFNQRVVALLTNLGRRAMGWDEVLHEAMPSMVVQNWRGATTRDRVLQRSLDCVVSAGFYLDLFYPADVYYGFDPEADQAVLVTYEQQLREDLRLQHVAQGMAWTDQWRRDAITLDSTAVNLGAVIGGEACLWAELVDEHTLDIRLWSGLGAVAERLWSAPINDEADFYRRLSITLELQPFDLAARQRQALAGLGLTNDQIEVAMLLEPVKWYARLLGEEALAARLSGGEMPQARPYQVDTPLNRVIDFISPESFKARSLRDLNVEQLRQEAKRWARVNPGDWPSDMHEVIRQFAAVAKVLEQTLSHTGPSAEVVESCMRALRDAYQPHGEYMLAIVPPLLAWFEGWRQP